MKRKGRGPGRKRENTTTPAGADWLPAEVGGGSSGRRASHQVSEGEKPLYFSFRLGGQVGGQGRGAGQRVSAARRRTIVVRAISDREGEVRRDYPSKG